MQEKYVLEMIREFEDREPGAALDLARKIACDETLIGVEFLTVAERRRMVCEVIRIQTGAQLPQSEGIVAALMDFYEVAEAA